MRTIGRLAMLTLVGLVLTVGSGCIKNEVLIQVKKDGSGTIIVKRVFSKEAATMIDFQMKQMESMMAAMAAQQGGDSQAMQMPTDPFFNEGLLRIEAALYGDNISFTKAEKYDKEGARGAVALYAFKNIADVRIPVSAMNDQSGGMMGGMGGMQGAPAPDPSECYSFKFVPGGEAKLYVNVPAFPEAPATEAAPDASALAMQKQQTDQLKQMIIAMGNPYRLTGDESQVELSRKLFKGTRLTLSVEVEGAAAKSNASYPSAAKKNRFVLYDMDMDKMMESKDFDKLMQNPNATDGVAAMAALKGAPGVSLETKPNVIIKF